MKLSGQKNYHQRKGASLERQHPGMVSSHNRATAHYGSVTGLKVTGDGLYLISAGQFLCFFLSPFDNNYGFSLYFYKVG